MASALAYYSEWAELPLLVLLMLFGPGVIAAYFIQTVQHFDGYPSRVRTDCGTENVTLAAIQAFLTGSTTSHVYSTSPGNQRIESCWSFFHRSRSQRWIELFESLQVFGAFHPDSVQVWITANIINFLPELAQL